MLRMRWLVAMMLAATALAVTAPSASARIKLATLPVRERVEIQLENENATLDIEDDMNQLRNEFCGGGKDRDASWELIGQTTDKTRVERKSAQKIEVHQPLAARPKEADKKPDEVIFLLHVWFRNEW